MPINKAFWNLKRVEPDFSQQLGRTYKALRVKTFDKQSIIVSENKRAGLTLKTVQRIEQGRAKEVGFPALKAAALALGLTVDELIERATAAPHADAAIPAEPVTAKYLQYLTTQRSSLLNPALLPWIQQTKINVRFLWPDLIVPTPLQSKRSLKSATVHDWETALGDARVAAIIGAPGSGKSTTLRYIALRLSDAFLKQTTLRFPIYKHLREYTEPHRRSKSSPLAKPHLDLPKHARIIFLIDGIDEVLEPKRSIVLSRIVRAARSETILLGCRTDVLSELGTPLNDALDEILELRGWDYTKHVIPFARNYFAKANIKNGFDTFQRTSEAIPEVKTLAANPFQLTLIFFLIQAEETITRDQFASKYALYRTFYGSWLTKERHRGTSKARQSRVSTLHRLLATMLYANKPKLIAFSKLARILREYKDVANDSAFVGLLLLYQDPASQEKFLQGFRHETLLEYLISEEIIHALQVGGPSLQKLLSTEYSSEVNQFVREGLTQVSADSRLLAADQISRAYYRLLKTELDLKASAARISHKAKLDENYRVREQMIYYAGRLALRNCPPVLVDAFAKDPDPILRRAAALGAILHGNYDVEQTYLERIDRIEKDAVLNRSIELVYRGDVEDSIYTFRDDGHHDWTRTRTAILTRLLGFTVRDIALRRWDLVTLKSFLVSRGPNGLSEAEWKIIEQTVCNIAGQPASRTSAMQKVKNEILKLRRQYQRAGR